MANFTVIKVQSLMDVCLQVYGTSQLLFRLASDNNLSIDSDIRIGQVLTFDENLGNLRIKNKTNNQRLDYVNPVPENRPNVEYWTDSFGTIFTDGLGNPWIANT